MNISKEIAPNFYKFSGKFANSTEVRFIPASQELPNSSYGGSPFLEVKQHWTTESRANVFCTGADCPVCGYVKDNPVLSKTVKIKTKYLANVICDGEVKVLNLCPSLKRSVDFYIFNKELVISLEEGNSFIIQRTENKRYNKSYPNKDKTSIKLPEFPYNLYLAAVSPEKKVESFIALLMGLVSEGPKKTFMGQPQKEEEDMGKMMEEALRREAEEEAAIAKKMAEQDPPPNDPSPTPAPRLTLTSSQSDDKVNAQKSISKASSENEIPRMLDMLEECDRIEPSGGKLSALAKATRDRFG